MLRQTVYQSTEGGGLSIREIAQSRCMSLGLGDEIAPVTPYLYGRPIRVSGIDQFILEQNPSGGGIAQRMFRADEAILGHLKNCRAVAARAQAYLAYPAR